jgi:nitrate reductase gamma subunit
VVAAGFGLWQAATLLNEQESGRVAAFTAGFAAMAFIQGCVILFSDRRSTPTVLMRPQAADAILAILPASVIGSLFVAVPEIRDPARPPFWLLVLFLGSMAISVRPAETALLAEVPPLGSVGFLDWVRSLNFGVGSLLVAILFTGMYFSSPLRVDALTPLIIMLALAQGAVCIWRLVEQHQMTKTGLHLSGMQIIWLRAIHVNQGHEAAVKELRAMYPKIGTTHAERVIENLYRTEEER